VIGDGDGEVLAGLVPGDHLADLDPDRPGAGELSVRPAKGLGRCSGKVQQPYRLFATGIDQHHVLNSQLDGTLGQYSLAAFGDLADDCRVTLSGGHKGQC
jgi:hypothetical protein